MPGYPWLLTDDMDLEKLDKKIAAMIKLGVPYDPSQVDTAVEEARAQAKVIGDNLAATGAEGMHDKEITALIAYLQRLGTDIKK